MQRERRFPTGLFCAALVALGVCDQPRQLAAQGIQIQFGGPRARTPNNGDGSDGLSMFVADRTVMQRLSRAQEAINGKEYPDAVRHLQAVLDHPEDFFYRPDKTKPTYLLGVKAEAQRLLGTLPTEGRELYELQYGAEARQLLAEAAERGDATSLATVVRRFFHTKAGREAAQALGSYYMDRGQPLAAALCFERVLKVPQLSAAEQPLLTLKTALCWQRAGLADQAARILKDWKPAAQHIEVAGRNVKLFADAAESLPWLAATFGAQGPLEQGPEDQWPMVRGNASRTAASQGGTPFLKNQWEVSTTSGHIPSDKDPLAEQDFDVAGALRVIEQSLQESNPTLVPAMSPLVVDNMVLFRTYHQLKAVDLMTGKLLWNSVEADRAFEQLQRNLPESPLPQHSQTARQTMLLQQRAWQDATYGTLSSNGTHVFSIEDLSFWGVFGFQGNTSDPLLPRDYNRITAYEIRTGKLKWEVGGPRGESNLELAGNFFLGPPLPLGKQLYCLAENSNEVRLLVLDASRKGKLEWSQTLAQVETNVMRDPQRRQAGLSPSIADGVLVCPIGAGAVVAVDLTTRQLLWASRYPSGVAADPQNRQQMMILRAQQFQMNSQSGMKPAEHWLDGLPLIDNGHVVITPRDSEQLHCLRLVDGSSVWSKPRGQGLYVAAIHDGHVIVVGRNQVEAFNLTDGTPAWPQPASLPLPSGRGFVTDNLLHLPLSTAEVATLDLETGRVLTRTKARDERPPGNLVCVRGMVVSQSPEAVAGFRQLSTLQEQVTQDLAKNPDDSAALALRGEIRLNAGQLAPAYADLRRALELNPAPETRRQLLGSLLEGLRIDFATYRQSADEIERFIETPEQRGNYYRLLAAGLQQAGERQAAFDVYLKLAAADAGAAPLLRLSEDLSVRRDRWVQAQLGELYAQASAADKAEFDRKLERQWEELRASEDADRVRAFLTQIGRQPIADDVRRRLVELLLPEGYTLEVEHELCLLERSSRPELAGFATAHLAAQLLQAGCVEEAAAAVARLGGRFADVVCLENRTGKQWAEIWADDPKLQAQRAAAAPWPAGPLVAEKVTGEPASSNYRISIPLEGRRGPFFDDRFLAIDQRQQRILGLDGLGREVWELPNNGLNVYFNATGLRARALNHLVLLASATQVLAVDTLGTPEDRKPRPIWRESLVEGFSGDHNNAIGNVRQVPLPGGGFKIVAYGQNNQPLGELGVIQPNCICVQRGRLLLGLDPRNGQLLWQRFDAPRGGEIFGDDEFVFVMAPQATEALVYRISDGQHVGNRPVPAANVRLKHFDRYVLSWAQAEENQVLSLLDVWDQKVVWKHAFALGSRLNLVQDEDVAILEPSGRFATVRLQDGQMALDSKLDANGPARQIFVLRSREFDILLSGTIAVNQPTERAYAFGNSNIVFTGTATCFQRFTGEKLWDRQLITQGLDLSLPPDLPLLIFATRHQKTNGTWDYQLQCLDKRTGKTILDLKDAGVMNILEASGDRTQKRVALSLFGQTTLQYQFTVGATE